MPTPLRFFTKVAHKWGKVDPNDPQAVENWYLTEFKKLPKKDLNAILDELLQYSDEESVKPEKIIYPDDVPFPLMKNTIPVTGYMWRNYYKYLVNYLRRLIGTSNTNK